MIPMSAELLADCTGFHDELTRMLTEASQDMLQRHADRARLEAMGLTPLDYRPGRSEWREVTRPERVRRNIRRNLASSMPNRRHRAFVAAPQGTETP